MKNKKVKKIYEIDDFLNLDLSKYPKPEEWNFLKALLAAICLGVVGWVLLWLCLFVTQSK